MPTGFHLTSVPRYGFHLQLPEEWFPEPVLVQEKQSGGEKMTGYAFSYFLENSLKSQVVDGSWTIVCL
jgi:hypothetical protein